MLLQCLQASVMLKILCSSFLIVPIIVTLSGSCQVSIFHHPEYLKLWYQLMSDNEVTCTFQTVALLLVSLPNLHISQWTTT